MAKKMRTINNPLDRQARNDFNYNFQAIDENFSETNQNLEVNVSEIKERLDEALDGRQLEELFEAATDARNQANEARIQASKAGNQAHHASEKGDYANEQGDYAKEQGDYANEKGLLAAEIVGEAEEAVSDLSELKIDVVESTQHANRQGDYAKEQADRAAPLVQKIEEVMPHLENMEHKEQWSEVTTYLKNQFVRFNGSTYQAKIKNKGQMPPVNDDDYWRLIAQRGTDGEGAVGSVNGILPDEQGNVDLGDFATKEYVNAQIDGIEIPEVDFTSLETKEDAESKLLDAKAYTDEEIAKVPGVDLSSLETKEDATTKLNEAKEYTDEKFDNIVIPEVDLTPYATKEELNEHADKNLVDEVHGMKVEGDTFMFKGEDGNWHEVTGGIDLDDLPEATLTQKGITRLSDSITSTSQTTAATSKAIKDINDQFNASMSPNEYTIRKNGYRIDAVEFTSKDNFVALSLKMSAEPGISPATGFINIWDFPYAKPKNTPSVALANGYTTSDAPLVIQTFSSVSSINADIKPGTAAINIIICYVKK